MMLCMTSTGINKMAVFWYKLFNEFSGFDPNGINWY